MLQGVSICAWNALLLADRSNSDSALEFYELVHNSLILSLIIGLMKLPKPGWYLREGWGV